MGLKEDFDTVGFECRLHGCFCYRYELREEQTVGGQLESRFFTPWPQGVLTIKQKRKAAVGLMVASFTVKTNSESIVF